VIGSIIAIVACFSAWALVHSMLASCAVKRWVRRTTGTRHLRWYRLAFNAVAALTLLPVLALVLLLPSRTLYVISFPWRWITLVAQALAFLALLRSLVQTDPLRFAGISQFFSNDGTEPGPLEVQGLYCYVRHPLYVFSTILIWLTPYMTTSLAALYGAMTLYFCLGSIPEEHKLLLQFGDAYARYREQVPRFLPRLRPCKAVEEQPEEAA
jgi:protein-S-isoprenylcysteine O-methyltransferase Ste14